ncbi:MAG: conjugal transfer protein [Clostridiales bacterium]|nr:conjugal transfer protein [Clostridiales bacterium]
MDEENKPEDFKKILRYSNQLAMLITLFSKGLITPTEYEAIKYTLMKDYKVISNILA